MNDPSLKKIKAFNMLTDCADSIEEEASAKDCCKIKITIPKELENLWKVKLSSIVTSLSEIEYFRENAKVQ